MPKPMLKELKLNEPAETFLLVVQKQERVTKTGDPYLVLRLADASGEIDANLWKEYAELFPQLKENIFVKVRGALGEYKGKKQFNVEKLRLAAEGEVELADFIRQTKKDIPQTLQKVKDILGSITDPDLKKLTALFLSDRELLADFARAPAAKDLHSACLGGLLEHTAALLELAVFLAGQYPLDRDLLLLGVFLHDIGKTRELSYPRAGESRLSFDYTDAGGLVGHIVIGVQILQEKLAALPDFPAQKKLLLEHMILAHHGLPEFGSPKTPLTKEAIALHHIDNIDAKLVGFDEFIEKNPTDTSWTVRAFMFENNKLYIGGRNAPAAAGAPKSEG
ncbi:MAG: HD domain-containing protein [Candidatus Margulisbacteria bacterium]|jgi:3'-5' exoribonuclease|nr:HD domain-containing protein [Candidatus Margulisiibacteriota bacterium]